MKSLNKIVKENLHRKYQMNESFERIFLNENHDDLSSLGNRSEERRVGKEC